MTMKKKILLFGGIFIGIILLIAAGSLTYMLSLTGLMQQGEVTGNMSLQELDLIDPEETVLPSTGFSTSEPGSSSATTGGEIAKTSEDAKTTAQTVPTTEKLPDIRTDPDVTNILLIGTDNRGNETNGRSDAMIIFSINKRTKKIHLVSLMRGLYVNIPGRGWSMLNNSFSYGGSKLLRQTIEDNLRVTIHDFLLIDFSGFTQAIDLIGGVNIDLTQKEADYLNENFAAVLTEPMAAGLNLLDGAKALAYSRIRYIDSDYRRTERQRQVITALLDHMRGMDAIELDQLARELLPLVKTNLSGTEVCKPANTRSPRSCCPSGDLLKRLLSETFLWFNLILPTIFLRCRISFLMINRMHKSWV